MWETRLAVGSAGQSEVGSARHSVEVWEGRSVAAWEGRWARRWAKAWATNSAGASAGPEKVWRPKWVKGKGWGSNLDQVQTVRSDQVR